MIVAVGDGATVGGTCVAFCDGATVGDDVAGGIGISVLMGSDGLPFSSQDIVGGIFVPSIGLELAHEERMIDANPKSIIDSFISV